MHRRPGCLACRRESTWVVGRSEVMFKSTTMNRSCWMDWTLGGGALAQQHHYLDTSLGGGAGNYGVRCDATACNPVIYAPGPFATFPGVGWLKNLNISLQCGGNGIDWQAGNTLRISDSVIQGYAQYGVRAGTKRGGYGGFELINVYQEVGNCKNPPGKIGQAGVIAQGGTVKIEGGEAPTGWIPRFASTGNTDYRYYIVARHAKFGASNPLYAGRALTNGAGNIVVTTADIAGASSFDLLRVTAIG